MIGAGRDGGKAAHGNGVNADNRLSAGRDQAAQGELTDDAEAQYGGGAAERDAGAMEAPRP